MENTVKTVTILDAPASFPRDLTVGLGYASAPWWEEAGRLYILNCACADAAILCRNAGGKTFYWGAPHCLCQYRSDGKALADAPKISLPADYMTHARPIRSEEDLAIALDENRTFLARAAHRRAALGARGSY